MSSAGTPLPEASYPIPPPLSKAPWGTVREDIVYLNTLSIGFLTELWAGLQGGGGIIPSLISVALPTSGAITAYNAVCINAIGQASPPDLTVIADGRAIIGVATTTASGSGLSINVQPMGLVTNSAWTWTPGSPVWVGAGGVLTQTAPTGAGNWVRRIGLAISATDMFIGIGEMVELT